MRKLQALVRHILTETGISRENVAAFLDQGAVVLTGRNLGHGVEVCVLKYDGVIDIERSDYDGIALLALVSGWLQSHDPDRDGLEDPEVNAAVNDLSTTDVQIAVEFQERIEIVPDDAGSGSRRILTEPLLRRARINATSASCWNGFTAVASCMAGTTEQR